MLVSGFTLSLHHTIIITIKMVIVALIDMFMFQILTYQGYEKDLLFQLETDITDTVPSS